VLWARLENQNTKSFIALRDKVGERYSISQKFLRNRKLFAFTVIAVKEASSMSAFYVFPPQVMPCKALHNRAFSSCGFPFSPERQIKTCMYFTINFESS